MSASGPSGPLVSKLTFSRIFFQEHFQSVKQFGSRSGPTFCQSYGLGPNCLQRLSADDKEIVKSVLKKVCCSVYLKLMPMAFQIVFQEIMEANNKRTVFVQGLHRLEKNLNIQDRLQKSFKIKFFLEKYLKNTQRPYA